MQPPKPTKIVERRDRMFTRGRYAGRVVNEAVVSWEINGQRYRTRKLAIEAAALAAMEDEMLRLARAS